MAGNTLELIIQGTDKASKTLLSISREIDQMQKKMAIASAAMIGAGIAIVGGLLKMADSYTKAGDEIAKMAKRTGMATEAISEMKYMADLSGTSLANMETSIRMMQRGLLDASQGVGMAKDALGMLGIKLEDIAGLKPEDQFWKIAFALAEVEDPSIKAALAMDLFGRSGTSLLPILDEGKEGLAKMKQEAKELNIVFSEDAAEAAEKFQDAKTKIGKALAGLSAEIIEDLVPSLTKLFDKLVGIIERIKDWAAENPNLAKTIGMVGVALLGFGAAIAVILGVQKAILAVNAALIFLHSLTGIGIAKLVLAGIIAITSIELMNRAMKQFELSAIPETTAPEGGTMEEKRAAIMKAFGPPVLPEGFQHGGIVPGPLGQPIPIIAHGGEQFLGAGKAAGEIIVNVNVEGSVIAERDFAETIRQLFYDIKRRTGTLEMA